MSFSYWSVEILKQLQSITSTVTATIYRVLHIQSNAAVKTWTVSKIVSTLDMYLLDIVHLIHHLVLKTHEEFHKQKNLKELLLYIMLNNKPSFKHRQSKWYWERILPVTNDFSGICRRNLKRSKNQTMALLSLQGLSQSTMQLCQIFHTWRYVLQLMEYCGAYVATWVPLHFTPFTHEMLQLISSRYLLKEKTEDGTYTSTFQ